MLIRVDEIMADEVALMEEAELEALASMNTEQAGNQDVPPDEEMDSLLLSMDGQAPQAQPRPETPYGSDDDEYDHIFMDVIQEESRMAYQQPHAPNGDDDMMDMS